MPLLHVALVFGCIAAGFPVYHAWHISIGTSLLFAGAALVFFGMFLIALIWEPAEGIIETAAYILLAGAAAGAFILSGLTSELPLMKRSLLTMIPLASVSVLYTPVLVLYNIKEARAHRSGKRSR